MADSGLRIETGPAPSGQGQQRHDVVVLILHGELDFTSATVLDRQLRQLVADDARGLVLDVTDLSFCDSAGLAVLIGTHRRLARAGGGLTLRGVSGSLRRVMELTGMDSLLRTEPGEQPGS